VIVTPSVNANSNYGPEYGAHQLNNSLDCTFLLFIFWRRLIGTNSFLSNYITNLPHSVIPDN